MPAPTNTEKIDELTKVTSALDERIEAIRGNFGDIKKMGEGISSQFQELATEVARLDEALKHIRENLDKFDPTDRLIRVEEGLRNAVKDQGDRLTKLEVKLDHLEKQGSEEHGRNWAIKLAVISALIGSVFTILTQLLSRYLPAK